MTKRTQLCSELVVPFPSLRNDYNTPMSLLTVVCLSSLWYVGRSCRLSKHFPGSLLAPERQGRLPFAFTLEQADLEVQVSEDFLLTMYSLLGKCAKGKRKSIRTVVQAIRLSCKQASGFEVVWPPAYLALKPRLRHGDCL
jgi:hypothetical protein